MLTRLYLYGPSMQSIGKGYVVASRAGGPAASDVIAALIPTESGRWLSHGQTSVRIERNNEHPTAIALHTGPLWLHTEQARERIFQDLLVITQRVAQEVKERGGLLLPNAVRADADRRIPFPTCGDSHVLHAADVIEQATCCNLLRLYLPELIALSGRAGVSPLGVETLGSRRLSSSRRHVAARYFHSTDPRFLDVLEPVLQRDGGVPSLGFLDVNPRMKSESSRHAIEVRAIDGQALWPSVRAHAIVLQALLIRARRMARQGQDAPMIAQDLLEQDRARAVAAGLSAWCGPQRSPLRSLRDAALDLVMDLREELQVLEVAYHELAPLVHGPLLRQLGRPAIQTESELCRALFRQVQEGRFIERIGELVTQPAQSMELLVGPHENPQTREAAALAKHRWGMLLSSTAAPAESVERNESGGVS